MQKTHREKAEGWLKNAVCFQGLVFCFVLFDVGLTSPDPALNMLSQSIWPACRRQKPTKLFFFFFLSTQAFVLGHEDEKKPTILEVCHLYKLVTAPLPIRLPTTTLFNSRSLTHESIEAGEMEDLSNMAPGCCEISKISARLTGGLRAGRSSEGVRKHGRAWELETFIII